MITSLIDALEADMVAGAQREVAIRDIDQLQRSAANQVPSPGTFQRIDSRLPTCQANTAGLHAQPRRGQTRHAGQARWQIAEIWETRAEADGIDGVFRFAVP